jgi:hypothetical protein
MILYFYFLFSVLGAESIAKQHRDKEAQRSAQSQRDVSEYG